MESAMIVETASRESCSRSAKTMIGASVGFVFAVAGQAWEIGGQLAGCRVDRRLHVASRRVDVAVQVQLQA